MLRRIFVLLTAGTGIAADAWPAAGAERRRDRRRCRAFSPRCTGKSSLPRTCCFRRSLGPGRHQEKLPGYGAAHQQSSRRSALLISSELFGRWFHVEFEPVTGTFGRASGSFGPIFAERALTIGRKKLNVGVNYQHVGFDQLDGKDLTGGELVGYTGLPYQYGERKSPGRHLFSGSARFAPDHGHGQRVRYLRPERSARRGCGRSHQSRQREGNDYFQVRQYDHRHRKSDAPATSTLARVTGSTGSSCR